MNAAHFVHGFNVEDGGANTTDKLIPYFQDYYDVIQHDYGWMGLLGTRLCNRGIANQVAAIASKGDIGVGHSNGCAILAMAADMKAPFDGLVLINPALDQDWKFAPQLKWIHVYYNRGDRPVWFARFRPLSPWGSMGRYGPDPGDPRVIGYDCYPDINGHSELFAKSKIWGPTIATRAAMS